MTDALYLISTGCLAFFFFKLSSSVHHVPYTQRDTMLGTTCILFLSLSLIAHGTAQKRARVAEYFQWNIRARTLQFSSVRSLCDFYAALNLTHRFASRNHQKMHQLFGAESSIINHSADGKMNTFLEQRILFFVAAFSFEKEIVPKTAS